MFRPHDLLLNGWQMRMGSLTPPLLVAMCSQFSTDFGLEEDSLFVVRALESWQSEKNSSELHVDVMSVGGDSRSGPELLERWSFRHAQFRNPSVFFSPFCGRVYFRWERPCGSLCPPMLSFAPDSPSVDRELRSVYRKLVILTRCIRSKLRGMLCHRLLRDCTSASTFALDVDIRHREPEHSIKGLRPTAVSPAPFVSPPFSPLRLSHEDVLLG